MPSAYTNVSRMSVAYASMLPEQSFLVVATRRSGTHFDSLPNVACASLAAYASGPEPQTEYPEILGKWKNLKQRLALVPEMDLLLRAGLLEKFPNHFRDGLAVRNAWRSLLSQEQIVTVMCGDDSNPYTRLPVLLARQKGIPTLDFHHGALDGRFLMKELPSDLYLAKGEMERDYLLRICGLPPERVAVAGPARSRTIPTQERAQDEKSQILFFSEPYESAGWRAEEIYREILPPLARLAHESGCKLVVKLHPFESRGVPCFLCEWLTSSPYGYTSQYARFGVGRILQSREELNEIPRVMTELALPLSPDCLLKPMNPEWLRQIIAGAASRKETVRTILR